MLSVAICIIAVLVGIGVKHRQNGSINDREVIFDNKPEDLQQPLRIP